MLCTWISFTSTTNRLLHRPYILTCSFRLCSGEGVDSRISRVTPRHANVQPLSSVKLHQCSVVRDKLPFFYGTKCNFNNIPAYVENGVDGNAPNPAWYHGLSKPIRVEPSPIPPHQVVSEPPVIQIVVYIIWIVFENMIWDHVGDKILKSNFHE